MRINDAILGMIIIVISVPLFFYARTFPSLPGIAYGSGFFPSIVLGFMIFAAIFLVFKGVAARKTTGWFSFDEWAKKPRTYLTLGLVAAAHLFYLFFSEHLGFLLTSIFLLFCLLVWTRGHKHLVSSAMISILFSCFVYYLFGIVLRVPLPTGLMKGLL
jgi:putative tricarboxylic transport membrane protein